MFSSISSMSSSMTTSLQLAKDCLESEKVDSSKTEQIEGVQKFAHMIDSGMKSFLSKTMFLFLLNSDCYLLCILFVLYPSQKQFY